MQEQTYREQPLHIRAKLAEEFQTLTLLERELSNRAVGTFRPTCGRLGVVA